MADSSSTSTISQPLPLISPLTLMRKITMIWMLNQVPADPAEHNFQNEHVNQAPLGPFQDLPPDMPKQLSRQQEREIVDSLSFLSATSDDPLNVMAVGMEEQVSGSGIAFRFASNTGERSKLEMEMRRLAELLMRASQGEDTLARGTRFLLERICQLDRDRILTRLRSRHARTSRLTKDKGKPLLLPQLHASVNHASIGANDRLSSLDLELVRKKAMQLLDISDELEGLDILDSFAINRNLVKIIELCYELSQVKLSHVLATSRSHVANLKTFLPLAVGKIGRYHNACQILVSAARAFPSLFGHIDVEICPLISTAEVESGEPQTCTSIGVDLGLLPSSEIARESRADAYGCTEELGAQLEEKIQALFSMSSSEVAQQVQRRIDDNTRYRRVHAEIQLLYHYFIHPELPRPRFISSNKSACFLCDLFFKSQGKIQLLRTHGRIYDKWILPQRNSMDDSPGQKAFQDIVATFNESLAWELGKLAHEGIAFRQHPNESVLRLYDPWPPLLPLKCERAVAEMSQDDDLPCHEIRKLEEPILLVPGPQNQYPQSAAL